ncbi:hypothetical protein ACCO45_007225 [Purpureocillium lilacinum]|uniref:Uncharacterized protein n=1 Tax=Purpureocillium lilacinum TaxID=33203 RepID=A0ACC4DUT5_PURLI
MATSKELVDDFRSLKRFYTWDKYLRFLGPRGPPQHPGAGEPQDSELMQMYERLTRSIAPQGDVHGRDFGLPGLMSHEGIAFDDWLDLFLDYAIGLAIAHRRDEAYQICQAAKDSTVFQSSEHEFAIYVAWSVCAIYTNDEERCVALARHLMRDGAITDSYRMFALLSRLCQSPVSWYTSGPAQKFILRQIKAIDARHEGTPAEALGRSGIIDAGGGERVTGFEVDVCLLMLYGHILFTSTSYAYSLGYFLRARSLDPTNSMVNLSLGLAYVHYGLKPKAERFYNVGRLFQLLGISYMGSNYYSTALELCRGAEGGEDLSACILMNSIVSLLSVGNKALAFSVLKSNLKL